MYQLKEAAPPPPVAASITITCDLGTIPSGKTVRIFYAAAISTSAQVTPGKKINTVVVTSSNADQVTSKAVTEITKPKGLSDQEINKILKNVRECAVTLNDLPFIDQVNTIIDSYQTHKIDGQQVISSLIQDTYDLVLKAVNNSLLNLLNQIFAAPSCIEYGRYVFSS